LEIASGVLMDNNVTLFASLSKSYRDLVYLQYAYWC